MAGTNGVKPITAVGTVILPMLPDAATGANVVKPSTVVSGTGIG